MNIILNGEAIHTEHQTLGTLVASLSLSAQRFAVEMNEQIIPKSKLADTPLSENAKIEIIQAVGGG
ncbi:MAG: sulfur carrier protein ThiS [Acinetobacter sp.]|nr:sulfur carrier protein ThiS [Acinetobacter sp.]